MDLTLLLQISMANCPHGPIYHFKERTKENRLIKRPGIIVSPVSSNSYIITEKSLSALWDVISSEKNLQHNNSFFNFNLITIHSIKILAFLTFLSRKAKSNSTIVYFQTSQIFCISKAAALACSADSFIQHCSFKCNVRTSTI